MMANTALESKAFRGPEDRNVFSIMRKTFPRRLQAVSIGQDWLGAQVLAAQEVGEVRMVLLAYSGKLAAQGRRRENNSWKPRVFA